MMRDNLPGDSLVSTFVKKQNRRYIRHQLDTSIQVFGREYQSGGTLHHPMLRYRNSTSLSRSEEHTSELQSLMRISYAVFCLKKKTLTLTLLKSIQLHMTC